MPSAAKRPRESCDREASEVPPGEVSDSLVRLREEWSVMHNGSVLALLPTPETVDRVLIYSTDDHRVGVVKIACFDLDDTLVVPQSGAVFPTDSPGDWKWLHPNVPIYLRRLHKAGFLVSIMSNQGGIGKAKRWNADKAEAIQGKVIQMGRDLGIPLTALVATRGDQWRKPNTLMWDLLKSHIREVAKLDPSASLDCDRMSFYVGDAAGRGTKTLAGRKKDFSCSDRKFAYNLSIPFLVPEQVYLTTEGRLLEESSDGVGPVLCKDLLQQLDPPDDIDWHGVGPQDLHSLPSSYAGLRLTCLTPAGESEMVLADPVRFARTDKQEMVLFIGFPASGKSTFFKRFFEPFGYVHINQDSLKTRAVCATLADKSWVAGRSVVVDNVSATAASRDLFIDIVRKYHNGTGTPLPVRVFVFGHTKALAIHMDNVRSKVNLSPGIPAVAFNVYRSRYIPLTLETVRQSGIEMVVEIPPVASFEGLPEKVKKEFYVLS